MPGLPASKWVWNFFNTCRFGHGRLVAALGVLGAFLQSLLHRFQVRQNQFRRNRLDVAPRVDGSRHVMDVRVLKTTDDLHQGIHLPDVAEKLVAQAFALRRRP